MIHTPDQRVRVFVSSALGELAAERRPVRDTRANAEQWPAESPRLRDGRSPGYAPPASAAVQRIRIRLLNQGDDAPGGRGRPPLMLFPRLDDDGLAVEVVAEDLRSPAGVPGFPERVS
jgi:hypothetical protein